MCKTKYNNRVMPLNVSFEIFFEKLKEDDLHKKIQRLPGCRVNLLNKFYRKNKIDDFIVFGTTQSINVRVCFFFSKIKFD